MGVPKKILKGECMKKVIGLLSVILAGILVVGCGDPVPVEEIKGGEIIGYQENIPVFKYHPASIQTTLTAWNSSTKTLSVTLLDPVGATYQWYKTDSFSNQGGTPIPAANAATYVVPSEDITAEGDYFYYVVTGESASNVAKISIVASATPPETIFQIGLDRVNYVRGVGGSGSFMFRTGSNADASPDADVNYIDYLFGLLGCNILRIMVQDDYLNYITNAVQSRNQGVFFHNARDNFFPVIQRANKYGGYVFANPWTAPASMKSGDTVQGGNLKSGGPNYTDYANHLRDFLIWLNDNEAPIFAIGICNEPDFGGGSNYEGMGISATVGRDWFKTVGHFTTQQVTNRINASPTTSTFQDDIIPGFGGGKETHHVLTMSGDPMGDIAGHYDAQLNDAVSNNRIELMGRHYYAAGAERYGAVVGDPRTVNWADRPNKNAGNRVYTGPFEAEALAQSPQMYAPHSVAGSIKREIWQTEHDFNYTGVSTVPPEGGVHFTWNSVFAALNDVDWCLRVAGESVFDWWYSQTFSGLVTSYQPSGFPPYTVTPRGRAFAHYARYVNETWLLRISATSGGTGFNQVFNTFNVGSTDPKISAFEDVNGKFISVVMFAPSYSPVSPTGGSIGASYGAGGVYGNDDPTRGSANVGRIAVKVPAGFKAHSATAIRSYGNGIADGQSWDTVPAGTPRYWIDEPVYLSSDGTVEVYLPGGNVISIMIRGEWESSANRQVLTGANERVRPYNVW